MQAAFPVEVMSDLDAKRERANGEAEKHRRQRDVLNTGTREWVEKRDALNAQVREIVETATGHRQRRDELNVQVQAKKAERDVLNRRVNELLARTNDLKRTKAPRPDGISVSRLRRELRDMEYRQQTTVMKPAEEKALIERASRLQAEIKKREKEIEKDTEVAHAMKELNEAREAAEEAHRLVGVLADEAQAEHDKMVALFEQSDALRHEADLAQEEFIRTKNSADEQHRLHIEYIRQVHDFDKILHSMRLRGGIPSPGREKLTKRQAEAIFERFRKGEKLSTEDLMTLQKSGYL